MNKKTEWILFILLMITLILLEALCARLAYETLGEIMSTVYALLVILNLIPLLLFFRHRTTATLIAVVLALVIIPYQLILADRLWRTQAEANHVVADLYEQRLSAGQYPPDLIAYRFHDPDMAAYIHDYQIDETRGGYVLSYWVGTPTTSHTYSPTTGWTYYPD
jgi:hypothetical protein